MTPEVTPEALTFASERIAAEMIDAHAARQLSGLTEQGNAAAFAMAAIAAAMSLFVATGVPPAEAARRIGECAAGVAEDLA